MLGLADHHAGPEDLVPAIDAAYATRTDAAARPVDRAAIGMPMPKTHNRRGDR